MEAKNNVYDRYKFRSLFKGEREKLNDNTVNYVGYGLKMMMQ